MIHYIIIIATLTLLCSRILTIRKPYMINELITNWRILLVVSLVITQLYLLRNPIQELRSVEIPQGMLRRMLQYLQTVYNDVLNATVRKLLKISVIKQLVELYARILRNTMLNKYIIYFHIITYAQSLKLLLSMTLLIDVFLFNKILGFYKYFYIGAIPIIYYILHRLMKIFYNDNFEYLKSTESLDLGELEHNLQTLDIVNALELSRQTTWYHYSNLLIYGSQIAAWSYYIVLYFHNHSGLYQNDSLLFILLLQVWPL